MLASFWVLMCRIPVVLSGERKALLDSFMIVRNFSMFLRLQSIDMDGVISSLNFVFFSLSASYFLLFFYLFNFFLIFSPPYWKLCALPMCFGGWARNSVPQWHRLVPIAHSCFWCWSTYILVYSLPWRRASNAVCSVELVLIPSSLAMSFCLFTSLPRCAILN